MISDPLDDARRWTASRHTHIRAFAVGRGVGERQYVQAEFASIEEARSAARRQGRDLVGRRPTIYALTPEGWALPVETVECE